MLATIDWQEAVHNPRFWNVYYRKSFRDFPGVTWEESLAYYHKLVGSEENVDQDEREEEEEREEGWTVSFSFPENYRWQIDYTTEDEMESGAFHYLFHPDLPPEGVYMAVQSPDDHLPGLRWVELKQIATCLTRHWSGDFDVRAVIPLLYPVVEYISFDEVEEVRQTLAKAWQDLHVLDATQIDEWLDEIIEVYEKGQILSRSTHQEWKPFFKHPFFNQQDLWIQTGENEWKTSSPRSMRSMKEDTRHLRPFFAMLQRYARL